MKRILFVLTVLISVAVFSSCSELTKKMKDRLMEKVEATAEAEEAEESGTGETTETEIPQAAAAEKEKKDPTDWVKGDFRLEFDYQLAVMTMTTPKENVKFVKSGDVCYGISNNGKVEAQVLYRLENDTVVKYRFNPKKKNVQRTVLKYTPTVADAVRGLLKDHVLDMKNFKKGKKTDSEKVSGIQCDVYEQVQKNIAGEGRNTFWVDRDQRFCVKKQVYLKLKDKESDNVVYTLKSFSDDKVDPKEVEFDFSEYTLL